MTEHSAVEQARIAAGLPIRGAKKVCGITHDEHMLGHREAASVDDIMECADISQVAHLMCQLGEGAQTSDCELLYLVVLSLHSFQPTGTDEQNQAVLYWQDKARDWFPEF